MSIHELDSVLQCFVNYHEQKNLETACSGALSMLEELQVVTEWNELVKTVDVIHDNLQFEINYLKKTIDHPRSIDIQDLSLCLRQYNSQQNLEPALVREGQTILHAFGMSINIDVNYNFMRVLSIASNVVHLDKIELMTKEGGYGISQSTVKEFLGIETDVKSKILDSLRNNADMFDLLGIALLLGINIEIKDLDGLSRSLLCGGLEEKKMFYFIYDSSCDIISPLLPLKTPLKEDHYPCEYNIWCQSTANDQFINKCKACMLTYHLYCTGTLGSCGCNDINLMYNRMDWVLEEDRVKRRLLHYKDGIQGWLLNILRSYKNTKRLQLLNLYLSTGKSTELNEINQFFENWVNIFPREDILHTISEVLSSDAMLIAAFKQMYVEEQRKDVTEKLLYPELLKVLIVKSGGTVNVNDLTLERAAYNLGHGIGFFE